MDIDSRREAGLIAAVIQARMGSTRLPGKVLAPLGSTTVLGCLVDRVKQTRSLDHIIVALPDTDENLPLVRACQELGIEWFQGSELDVLSRYYLACQRFGVNTVVRITSDCPFYDPKLLDTMLSDFKQWQQAREGVEYYGNFYPKRTFPRGLDTEIFTREALEEAHAEACEPYEREHVTPFIYTHPDRFHLRSRENETDLSEHRWVLDTPDDLHFVRKVFETLHDDGGFFATQEILDLLQSEPGLKRINADVKQKHADNRFHGAGSK